MFTLHRHAPSGSLSMRCRMCLAATREHELFRTGARVQQPGAHQQGHAAGRAASSGLEPHGAPLYRRLAAGRPSGWRLLWRCIPTAPFFVLIALLVCVETRWTQDPNVVPTPSVDYRQPLGLQASVAMLTPPQPFVFGQHPPSLPPPLPFASPSPTLGPSAQHYAELQRQQQNGFAGGCSLATGNGHSAEEYDSAVRASDACLLAQVLLQLEPQAPMWARQECGM